MKSLILAAFAVQMLFLAGNAKPQLGSLFGSIFSNECKEAVKRMERDSSIKAIIFDEDKCDVGTLGGWELDLKEGYTELGSRGLILKNDDSKKDDAESLIVRPGCLVIGYTKHDEKDYLDRGRGVTFDATTKKPGDYLIIEKFEDDNIEEGLDAVEVFCGPAALKAKEVEPLTQLGGSGVTDTIRGIFSDKSSVKECNYSLFLLNVAKVGGKRVCAVLFDEDKCNKGDKDSWRVIVPEGYTALPFLKKNDAESVMVRPGCKLIGYDHDEKQVSKRGTSFTIDANTANKRSSPKQALFRDLKTDRELREEISAVDCIC